MWFIKPFYVVKYIYCTCMLSTIPCQILLRLQTDLPKVVGWERNDKQKLAPKMVNLSSSMDPVRSVVDDIMMMSSFNMNESVWTKNLFFSFLRLNNS